MDVKETIQELGAAFEQFKKSNDERLEKMAKGESIALLEEKLATINNHLNQLEEMKSRLEGIEKKAGRPGQFGAGDDGADEYKSAFDTFMRKGDATALEEIQAKAMSVGSDADGGFAVPESLDRQISAVLRDDNVMRSVCNVQMVGNSNYSKLFKVGNAGSGWVGETAERPATGTPQLVKIAPVMGEIYANPEVTQQMLDDAMFDVQSWLMSEVRSEFSEQEEEAFTIGNGVNKPKGVFAYEMTIEADSERAFGKLQKFVTKGVAITGDELINLVYGMKKKYRRNARFMMNGNSVAAIRKLKDSQGNYLWVPGLQSGQASSLLGYSIAENESMADISASAAAVAFGDFFRGYTIVDRMGTRVLRDPYTNKPFVGFYTTKRVGGMLNDSNAIKVLEIKSA